MLHHIPGPVAPDGETTNESIARSAAMTALPSKIADRLGAACRSQRPTRQTLPSCEQPKTPFATAAETAVSLSAIGQKMRMPMSARLKPSDVRRPGGCRQGGGNGAGHDPRRGVRVGCRFLQRGQLDDAALGEHRRARSGRRAGGWSSTWSGSRCGCSALWLRWARSSSRLLPCITACCRCSSPFWSLSLSSWCCAGCGPARTWPAPRGPPCSSSARHWLCSSPSPSPPAGAPPLRRRSGCPRYRCSAAASPC